MTSDDKMTSDIKITGRSTLLSKSLFAKLTLIACVGGIIIGHFFIHQFSMPAETALRISEAALIADGAQPYADVLDNASPFFIYINLAPVMLSRLIYIHPICLTNLFNALAFILAAGSLAQISEILPARRNALSVSIWSVLVALILVTCLQPMHFAQANQIFFLALCPYIVCRACTIRALPVPPELAGAIGAAISFATLLDPIYFLYLFCLELCILFGFFPFSNRRFILLRYFGTELKLAAAILSITIVGWMLMPSNCANEYLGVITKLNYYSYCDTLNALNFSGAASDTRALIYLAAFFLIVTLPTARRNLLVRLFAIASFLGFGLMVIQGATLAYQTYLLLGFSVMALAAGLPRQTAPWWRFVYERFFSKLKRPTFNWQEKMFVPALIASLCLCAGGVYLIELAALAQPFRFDLRQLGYYCIADRRDLTICSATVEEFSRPRDSVAILGLGVRPAYPLLTQLRRKPGLSLIWGFPIDILDILEEPYHANEMAELRLFKSRMYETMTKELSAISGAPVLVLVDGDEVRRILQERGVMEALERNYSCLGGVSLVDPADKDGHPTLEYVGYRSAFVIFRHK